jgi:serine/threonine-protein phosphatase 6 catalytic subunit
LITVWSSPNYCYRCGNVAAILNFDEYLKKTITIFNSVAESAKSINPKFVLPYFL